MRNSRLKGVYEVLGACRNDLRPLVAYPPWPAVRLRDAPAQLVTDALPFAFVLPASSD
jgi:hypothetical protein